MTKKNVAFKIRIDEGLRRAFVEACRAQDRPAAQVVREFMRRFVAVGSESNQADGPTAATRRPGNVEVKHKAEG